MASTPEQGRYLSPREADVLRALAGGCYTAKSVARKLGISHRTVEHHVTNAIVKLGAENQLHAVLLWDRAGLHATLQQIADMDPKGLRADDLGRAARTAREALNSFGVALPREGQQ